MVSYQFTEIDGLFSFDNSRSWRQFRGSLGAWSICSCCRSLDEAAWSLQYAPTLTCMANVTGRRFCDAQPNHSWAGREANWRWGSVRWLDHDSWDDLEFIEHFPSDHFGVSGPTSRWVYVKMTKDEVKRRKWSRESPSRLGNTADLLISIGHRFKVPCPWIPPIWASGYGDGEVKDTYRETWGDSTDAWIAWVWQDT